jgi:catechol-2,3-dioxygenase
MKLNHINLTVTNVQEASDFLVKYFGMRSMGGNIGFFIDSKESVDRIYWRLKQDDFDVPAPEDTGHSYGFYVKAPGGFMVEVGA